MSLPPGRVGVRRKALGGIDTTLAAASVSDDAGGGEMKAIDRTEELHAKKGGYQWGGRGREEIDGCGADAGGLVESFPTFYFQIEIGNDTDDPNFQTN